MIPFCAAIRHTPPFHQASRMASGIYFDKSIWIGKLIMGGVSGFERGETRNPLNKLHKSCLR